MQLRGAQQLPSRPQDGQSKIQTLVGLPAITPTRPLLLQPDPTTHHSPSKLLLVYISELLSKLLSLVGRASSICPWSESLCPSRSSSDGSFSVKSSPTTLSISFCILGSPQCLGEPGNQAKPPHL